VNDEAFFTGMRQVWIKDKYAALSDTGNSGVEEERPEESYLSLPGAFSARETNGNKVGNCGNYASHSK
jgi:hypothetical protein